MSEENYDDDEFLEEDLVRQPAPPAATKQSTQSPSRDSPYSSRSSTPRTKSSGSQSRSDSGSRSPSPTSSPSYPRSDKQVRHEGAARKQPPHHAQAAAPAASAASFSSRGPAAPALQPNQSATRIVATKQATAVVRRENSDDIEILVGRPSQLKPQSNSANNIAASREPSNTKSSPRRSVQADVLDEDEDDEPLVDASPRKMPSSKAAPALVALAARQAPVRQSVVAKPTGGAAVRGSPPPAAKMQHHHPTPPPPAPPPRPPPPQPVMREVIPRDLQSLVQTRDQLRQEVADLKVALNDPSGISVVSQEKAQRLFFETLEKENVRLDAEVHALKSGLSNNGLSDKLFSLSKEIAERDAVLKAWYRERRKVTEEIKVLTKVAAGDETTADDDRFFKKRELIVGEQEEHRLRHRRHMDELALKLDKAQRSTEAAERKASSLEQVVEEEQVADLVSSEYTLRLKQLESNAKRIAHLKNVLAAMESTYEPPAPSADIHDKRGLAELEEAKQRVWQLLKMIRVKETVIMKNYDLADRPSFFCNPNDSSHFPSLGTVAKPPLPQVPIVPQPPKKAAPENNPPPKEKSKPLTARKAGRIGAAAPEATGETRTKPTSASHTRSTAAPQSAPKTKLRLPMITRAKQQRPPRPAEVSAVKSGEGAEGQTAAAPPDAPCAPSSDAPLQQSLRQLSSQASRRSSPMSSHRSSSTSSRSQSSRSDRGKSKSQANDVSGGADGPVPALGAGDEKRTERSGDKDEQYEDEFEEEPPQQQPAAQPPTGEALAVVGQTGSADEITASEAPKNSGAPPVPANPDVGPDMSSPSIAEPQEEAPQWLDDPEPPSDAAAVSEVPSVATRQGPDASQAAQRDSKTEVVGNPPPSQHQIPPVEVVASSPQKDELPAWLADE